MDREKSIDVLNTLLQINNDRSQGYQAAILETEDYGLKLLLSECQQTSERNIIELQTEIIKMGGMPLKGTDFASKVHRVWMELKAATTGHDRDLILSSCAYGDDYAIDAYKTAIKDNLEDFNAEVKSLLVGQSFLIRADQARVKALERVFS